MSHQERHRLSISIHLCLRDYRYWCFSCQHGIVLTTWDCCCASIIPGTDCDHLAPPRPGLCNRHLSNWNRQRGLQLLHVQKFKSASRRYTIDVLHQVQLLLRPCRGNQLPGWTIIRGRKRLVYRTRASTTRANHSCWRYSSPKAPKDFDKVQQLEQYS